MSKKIAPKLQRAVSNGTGWSLGLEHDEAARRELRALLAVARAVNRMSFTRQDAVTTLAYTEEVEALKKARERLSRVSGGKP